MDMSLSKLQEIVKDSSRMLQSMGRKELDMTEWLALTISLQNRSASVVLHMPAKRKQ